VGTKVRYDPALGVVLRLAKALVVTVVELLDFK
jgi:hypothetical protein